METINPLYAMQMCMPIWSLVISFFDHVSNFTVQSNNRENVGKNSYSGMTLFYKQHFRPSLASTINLMSNMPTKETKSGRTQLMETWKPFSRTQLVHLIVWKGIHWSEKKKMLGWFFFIPKVCSFRHIRAQLLSIMRYSWTYNFLLCTRT